MAPSDDLKSHATTSSHDFYALLDIAPAAAESEIRRAYRRTALKYHPDKIANPTPADLEKFHLLQIAYDVLSEPDVRQLYDNAREARGRRKREEEMLHGVRRKMKEDLEARERGVKRSAETVEREAEDELEREIRRLAEDGRRRRRAREEELRRDILEEEERLEREREDAEKRQQGQGQGQNGDRDRNGARYENAGGMAVSEIDRTVKVRWVREACGVEFDKERLEELFSTFGEVESAFTLKDKRQRVGERREKKTIATGVVVFSSVVYAHAAVEDSKKQHGDEWDAIQSVFWASGNEPNWESHRPSPTPQDQEKCRHSPVAPAPQSTSKSRDPHSFPGLGSQPSAPDKKPPSFGSFGKGAPSGMGSTSGTNSPSLEEITLIRLKNAERKKLEEQIRKDETAEDESTK